MESDDTALGRVRLPKRCLFTLDLKTPKLWVVGKKEAGRVFQTVTVDIRNGKSKRFQLIFKGFVYYVRI